MIYAFVVVVAINFSIILLSAFTIIVLGNPLGMVGFFLLRELPYALLFEANKEKNSSDKDKPKPIGFIHH